MSTRTILSTVGRLAMSAACVIATSACGGELLRTGRSPVFLVVDRIEATPEGGTAAAFLLSDVRTEEGTVFNDNALVTVRSIEKNPSATATQINSVTLTRYRVVFRRTDGRNIPGVDVPYGFDGGLSLTLGPGSSGQAVFEVVRHQSKLEPPLANLAGFGGQGFISAIAEITLYGRDQNGNEVSVTALLDIHFGDFVDEDA